MASLLLEDEKLIQCTLTRYILKPVEQNGLGFKYPIFLTCFHMAFATVGTRLLARYTHLLDGLANVEMTNDRWVRNILPIGILFSASLALSNYAYLYLSVAYIQMIKVRLAILSNARSRPEHRLTQRLL